MESTGGWWWTGEKGVIRPMEAKDVDEVARAIRLHDTDDYEAACEVFERIEFSELPHAELGYLVGEPSDEDRPVGVCGWYAGDAEARDVYWLGWTYVNPYFQGEGWGSDLLEAVLHGVAAYGGRKMFVATSSLEKYEPAVAFYERHGFEFEGRLTDYYADGEDQLVYGRHLA